MPGGPAATPRRAARRLLGLGLTALVPLLPASALAQEQAQGQAQPPAAQSPAQAPRDSMPAVTLEEAIARGMKNASAIIQAEGGILTAKAAQKTAFGAYLPTASASATGTLSSSTRLNGTTGTTVTGASTSISAGVSVGWDVFTGFRRSATRRRTAADYESATAQLSEQERSTTLLVTQVFYEALRAEQLNTVATFRIERAEANLSAAERRASVGSSTRSDVLRAQLELNSARTAQIEARTTQRAAQFQLGQLVGLQGPARAQTPAAIPGGWNGELPENYVNDVVQSLPAVVSATAAVRASEASVAIARAAYLPTLRLSGGYDWFTQGVQFDEGRTSWSTRLSLSIPIFDGFARDESAERARVQQNVARAQLAELERSVRAEVETTVDRLRLATEKLKLAEQAVSVAQEDLRVQQERYGLGVSTMLELLTSQENLVTAETDEVGARFDTALAQAELESLSGRKL